ncbi:site-specific DNA-methyltransferase [Porticoccaceae bacterium]|nr:site-specific DNA-methyltransferase [Porticoccaceae bacterium]
MDMNIKIKYRPVNDLVPYDRNSRTHSDSQVEQVAKSIEEFGFTNPILIGDDNVVIAGHGRLMAAKTLGMDKVPTIELSHLSEEQRRAYVIADNRLAEESGWDEELLALELGALESSEYDLSLLGFNDKELADLVSSTPLPGLVDDDDAPEVEEKEVSVLGEIWILGSHRLMCGDSTSDYDLDLLMDGSKADLVFTDPPYNVKFNGRSGKHDVIKNDDLSNSDFDDFISGTCKTISRLKPAAYYVWCNWKFYAQLQGRLEYKACIVWAKNVFGLGRGYRHQHEFCLFNGSVDEIVKNESDLWEIKKDTNYVHPTQKPVALSVRAFSNHIKLLNVVDLFGGSGSTLIGAEQTGRRCFVMELDPKYCDVIIRRWQEYTGKQASLVSTGDPFDEVAKSRLTEGT